MENVCLICCSEYNSTKHQLDFNQTQNFGDLEQNLGFQMFCKSVNLNSTVLLNSLKTEWTNVSVCSKCLNIVGNTIDKKRIVEETEIKIRRLQRELLEAFQVQTTAVGIWHTELAKLGKIMENCHRYTLLLQRRKNATDKNQVGTFRKCLLEVTKQAPDFIWNLSHIQEEEKTMEIENTLDKEVVLQISEKTADLNNMARKEVEASSCKQTCEFYLIPEEQKLGTCETKVTAEYRVSETEKPFCCDHCKKSFSNKSNLLRHERIHSGEKPFSCRVCNSKFSQKSSLKEHMLRHAGEKPFRCRSCSASFSDSSNFSRHLKTHSGSKFKSNSCVFCKARFPFKAHLHDHIITHIMEKPYDCNLCDLSFNQSSNFRRHLKRVHRKIGQLDGNQK